jgi:putative effector of murein hydrolase
MSVDWLPLTDGPVLWVSVTLLAYAAGLEINRLAGGAGLANPVLIAILAVLLVLLATGTPYPTYLAGASFIHFMLGPTAVALAVPLYKYARDIRDNLPEVGTAIVVGSAAATGSAVGAAQAFGVAEPTLKALVLKAATTPVAIAVSPIIEAPQALVAVFVIATGIFGAMTCLGLLRLAGIRDERAIGLAHGVSCHALGTQRCFTVSERMGTFAAFAMGANAVLLALALPLAARLTAM